MTKGGSKRARELLSAICVIFEVTMLISNHKAAVIGLNLLTAVTIIVHLKKLLEI